MESGSKEGSTLLDCWIDEITDIAGKFDSISFNFCKRECNKVADLVAKHAKVSDLNCFWLSNYPEWVVNQVLKDSCQSLPSRLIE